MSNNKYYEEPSEFEEKCLELVEMIKDNATQELKAELEQLREENAKMKDIVDNYNQKVEELELEKKKYHWNEKALRSEIEKEVKNIRLGNLLKDFQSTLYAVRNVGKSKPKCDKCDKDGYIHYLSPRGREQIEKCECRDGIPFYKVLEANCCEFRIGNQYSVTEKIIGFYRLISESDCYATTVGVSDKMYDGRPFVDIENYYYVYFRDKDTAQRYADWLNERVEEE